MGMTRDEITGAIEALGMITSAAAEFKRIDVAERMSNVAREDQQAFQKELSDISWGRKMALEFPGVAMTDGVPDFTSYDWGKSSAAMAAKSASVQESLIEYNLPYDGTSQENIETLASFYQGRGIGANIMRSSVSPSVSLMLGDRTPGYFTEHDVGDFKEWFEGSGGADNPMALNQLVETRIISPDLLQVDKTTGLYTANERSKQLIDYAFQGLTTGARANESYMSVAKYEEMDEAKRFRGMQYGESITGHHYAVQASRIYADTKQALGARKINAQILENGEFTMQWKGNQVEVSNILESIGKQKGPFKDGSEKAAFLAYIEEIATVGPDGTGMDNLMLSTNANPEMLKLLFKFDRSLAKGINTALNQFNRIDSIAKHASSFIESPRDAAEVSSLRVVIQDTNLIYKLQELRNMEAAGETNTKKFKALDSELEALIPKITKQLRATGNKTLMNDFLNWLRLEESTGELFKESVARKVGQ